MKKILVVAPHPDDETIGCGGTLLKNKLEGNKIYWLIVTAFTKDEGYSDEVIKKRDNEIEKINSLYNFNAVFRLNYPTAKLDTLPLQDLITKVSQIINKIEPEVVYIPHPGDIHTDHKVVFQVLSACTKHFRYPFIKRVLAYEAISETDFNINPEVIPFHPNVFVDISEFLEQKLQIVNNYAGEIQNFPFPRSLETMRALAMLRGSAIGCRAAEAFVLLKEIN